MAAVYRSARAWKRWANSSSIWKWSAASVAFGQALGGPLFPAGQAGGAGCFVLIEGELVLLPGLGQREVELLDVAEDQAGLGKSDATINRYLSSLRTFLTWSKSRKYRTLPIKERAWRNW
jgi:hypothetical protein